MTNSGEGWIIVRTSAGRTLSLTKALVGAGIVAWSPSDVREWRLPRSSKRVEKGVPMMPGFVFVRAEHLAELIAARAQPVWQFPAFSIFRWNDGYPVVTDASLDPLRRHEAVRKTRRALKERRQAIPKGTKVKASSGGFEGMIGVVEESTGAYATISFPGWRVPIKVASCLLVADGVSGEPSQDDTAVRTAMAR